MWETKKGDPSKDFSIINGTGAVHKVVKPCKLHGGGGDDELCLFKYYSVHKPFSEI